MATPLTDARVVQIAAKEDLDPVMVDWVDAPFVRRLEESHARLLEQLERVEQGIAQLGKGTWTVRDITIWHSNIRAAIAAAKELK